MNVSIHHFFLTDRLPTISSAFNVKFRPCEVDGVILSDDADDFICPF